MSKFTKVNVAGDGACYFHAVTGFLEMEKKIKTINDTNYTYYSKNVGKASTGRKTKRWKSLWDQAQPDRKH